MQTLIIASQLFSLLTSQRTFFLKTLHNQMDEGSNQIENYNTETIDFQWFILLLTSLGGC